MVAVPHSDGRRPWCGVDPRRLADHRRQLGDRRADPARHARHDLDRSRADRIGLSHRPADRCAGVRQDVGPARAQAAADDHPAALPVRHRDGRVRHRPSHRLAGVLLRHPARRRDGHRRPVRGDQLGDRRDDAVEVPGPGRHLDQRHLLGGGDPRLARLADLPQRLRRQRRLAAGVPPRSSAGAGGHRRGPGPAGKPAVADDPRPRRRGRGGNGQDRGSPGHAARAGRRRCQRSSWCPKRSTATCSSCGWCSTPTRSGRSSARR